MHLFRLGLLFFWMSLAFLLSGCPLFRITVPLHAPILFYPQEPRLCPRGVQLVLRGEPYGQVITRATQRPSSPPPEGSRVMVPIDPVGVVGYRNTDPRETDRFTLLCYTDTGQLLGPGPKFPPRDSPLGDPLLVLVEDPNVPARVRGYWAYGFYE